MRQKSHEKDHNVKMAPIRKLSSSSAAPRKSILKSSSQPKKLESESLFATTKKDKRRIKHAQLISRVEKSSKKPRQRRPNKKLVTTLDSLADALPSEDDGSNDVAGGRPQDQVNIIKRKSIKSRPGAMKRREKLDQGERDRFAKNLAQMAASSSNNIANAASDAPKSEDRWKALRGFIDQTMEKRPESGRKS